MADLRSTPLRLLEVCQAGADCCEGADRSGKQSAFSSVVVALRQTPPGEAASSKALIR